MVWKIVHCVAVGDVKDGMERIVKSHKWLYSIYEIKRLMHLAKEELLRKIFEFFYEH